MPVRFKISSKTTGLSQYDMPSTPNKNLKAFPQFIKYLFPWLKSKLRAPWRNEESQKDHIPQALADFKTAFPFLELPHKVRDWIYGSTLLHPKQEIHPCARSWYDCTTHIIPLFLTYKRIHKGARLIVHGKGCLHHIVQRRRNL